MTSFSSPHVVTCNSMVAPKSNIVSLIGLSWRANMTRIWIVSLFRSHFLAISCFSSNPPGNLGVPLFFYQPRLAGEKVAEVEWGYTCLKVAGLELTPKSVQSPGLSLEPICCLTSLRTENALWTLKWCRGFHSWPWIVYVIVTLIVPSRTQHSHPEPELQQFTLEPCK